MIRLSRRCDLRFCSPARQSELSECLESKPAQHAGQTSELRSSPWRSRVGPLQKRSGSLKIQTHFHAALQMEELGERLALRTML